MSGDKNRSATRGLATVALLKVNFDSGRDYISMFEPFVLDTLAQLQADDFVAEDLCLAIIDRHQLTLPVNTLRVLLGRAAKQGHIRREAGRYFRAEKRPSVGDLRAERLRVEERQGRLARALREAAASRDVTIEADEDALAMVVEFLERYHVSFALDNVSLRAEVADPSEDEDGHARTTLTAGFLRDAVLAGGELAEIIQETLEGFVLQNTLLLKDISTAARRFRNLNVYCDSGLLFGALGFLGPDREKATRELFALLRDTGAVLNVFTTTIREMRRIFDVYEHHLGTSSGQLSLRPTDLTRYFLTNHYSPSDVRVQGGLIESKLGSLAVNIREVPLHKPELTLDEADLATRLKSHTGGEGEDRVVHDIECVAGVLTLRRGRTSDGLDDAGAVFVTTSGLTVRHIRQWYEDQGGAGTAPTVHYLLLSNLAWLKRPASAANLKVHELVALCVAALRPSRQAWQRFLDYLKDLESSNQLSSDELIAIVANRLTDQILVEENVDEDTDAATLSEVVRRVKATYREVADAEIRDATETAKRSEADATERAKRSEADALSLKMHVERSARNLARVVSSIVAVVLSLTFVAGTVVSIRTVASGSLPGIGELLLAIVPLAIAALLSVLYGFQLAAWRSSVEERIASWVKRWMAGPG